LTCAGTKKEDGQTIFRERQSANCSNLGFKIERDAHRSVTSEECHNTSHYPVTESREKLKLLKLGMQLLVQIPIAAVSFGVRAFKSVEREASR